MQHFAITCMALELKFRAHNEVVYKDEVSDKKQHPRKSTILVRANERPLLIQNSLSFNMITKFYMNKEIEIHQGQV